MDLTQTYRQLLLIYQICHNFKLGLNSLGLIDEDVGKYGFVNNYGDVLIVTVTELACYVKRQHQKQSSLVPIRNIVHKILLENV